MTAVADRSRVGGNLGLRTAWRALHGDTAPGAGRHRSSIELSQNGFQPAERILGERDDAPSLKVDMQGDQLLRRQPIPPRMT